MPWKYCIKWTSAYVYKVYRKNKWIWGLDLSSIPRIFSYVYKQIFQTPKIKSEIYNTGPPQALWVGILNPQLEMQVNENNYISGVTDEWKFFDTEYWVEESYFTWGEQ